jgi:hypothetical protein
VERTAAAIIRDFDSFAVGDFDEDDPAADGWERLAGLCDEASTIGGPACMPAMFDLMERFDRADLGSPGPLVHTIEGWPGQYEDLLADSIRRKPAPLTVWMVNRILNTQPDDAEVWLDLLRGVGDHPAASAQVKADAAGFLRYQARTPDH